MRPAGGRAAPTKLLGVAEAGHQRVAVLLRLRRGGGLQLKGAEHGLAGGRRHHCGGRRHHATGRGGGGSGRSGALQKEVEGIAEPIGRGGATGSSTVKLTVGPCSRLRRGRAVAPAWSGASELSALDDVGQAPQGRASPRNVAQLDWRQHKRGTHLLPDPSGAKSQRPS